MKGFFEKVRLLADLARHHILKSTLDDLARKEMARKYDAVGWPSHT